MHQRILPFGLHGQLCTPYPIMECCLSSAVDTPCAMLNQNVDTLYLTVVSNMLSSFCTTMTSIGKASCNWRYHPIRYHTQMSNWTQHARLCKALTRCISQMVLPVATERWQELLVLPVCLQPCTNQHSRVGSLFAIPSVNLHIIRGDQKPFCTTSSVRLLQWAAVAWVLLL